MNIKVLFQIKKSSNTNADPKTKNRNGSSNNIIQWLVLVINRDYMDDFKDNRHTMADTMKKHHKDWNNHSDINNKSIDKRNDTASTKNNDIEIGDSIKKGNGTVIYKINHTNVVSIINSNRCATHNSNVTHCFDNKIDMTTKENKTVSLHNISKKNHVKDTAKNFYIVD